MSGTNPLSNSPIGSESPQSFYPSNTTDFTCHQVALKSLEQPARTLKCSPLKAKREGNRSSDIKIPLRINLNGKDTQFTVSRSQKSHFLRDEVVGSFFEHALFRNKSLEPTYLHLPRFLSFFYDAMALETPSFTCEEFLDKARPIFMKIYSDSPTLLDCLNDKKLTGLLLYYVRLPSLEEDPSTTQFVSSFISDYTLPKASDYAEFLRFWKDGLSGCQQIPIYNELSQHQIQGIWLSLYSSYKHLNKSFSQDSFLKLAERAFSFIDQSYRLPPALDDNSLLNLTDFADDSTLSDFSDETLDSSFRSDSSEETVYSDHLSDSSEPLLDETMLLDAELLIPALNTYPFLDETSFRSLFLQIREFAAQKVTVEGKKQNISQVLSAEETVQLFQLINEKPTDNDASVAFAKFPHGIKHLPTGSILVQYAMAPNKWSYLELNSPAHTGYTCHVASYEDISQIKRLCHSFDVFMALQDIEGVAKVKDQRLYSFEENGHATHHGFFVEDCNGSSLKSLIKEGDLSEIQKIELALQMIRVLEQVHKKGFVHANLSSKAFYHTSSLSSDFDNSPSILLGDFDHAIQLSKPFPATEYKVSSSIEEAPPEIQEWLRKTPGDISQLKKIMTPELDNWSLGMILCEMFFGHQNPSELKSHAHDLSLEFVVLSLTEKQAGDRTSLKAASKLLQARLNFINPTKSI